MLLYFNILFTNNLSVGSIIISEHVLRRASKCSSLEHDSFDCFLLGNTSVDNNTISICIDRLDQGKEVISGMWHVDFI